MESNQYLDQNLKVDNLMEKKKKTQQPKKTPQTFILIDHLQSSKELFLLSCAGDRIMLQKPVAWSQVIMVNGQKCCLMCAISQFTELSTLFPDHNQFHSGFPIVVFPNAISIT